MKAEGFVLELTWPTHQELEEKSELAIGVLLVELYKRSFEITCSSEGAELRDGLSKVLWDWVYCGKPVDGKTAFERGLHLANDWDLSSAVVRTRKKGRPIKSRPTAIKALFRHIYLKKTWAEVTRRLCQCGKPHDDQLTLKKCQANIESNVRRLKTVLKKYDIAFPPPREESETVHKASESLQSKPQDLPKIATLEESSGAGRVADTLAIQHPAIGILLNSGPLPEILMASDESDALSLFNPWQPGWVPLWFSDICTEPIGTRKDLQQRRFDWFDKAFKHFAGPDWRRKGSLDSQKEVVARTLLQMYRAARDETLPPEVDELERLSKHVGDYVDENTIRWSFFPQHGVRLGVAARGVTVHLRWSGDVNPGLRVAEFHAGEPIELRLYLDNLTDTPLVWRSGADAFRVVVRVFGDSDMLPQAHAGIRRQNEVQATVLPHTWGYAQTLILNDLYDLALGTYEVVVGPCALTGDVGAANVPATGWPYTEGSATVETFVSIIP
jgi:hypothetical protein